MDIGDQDFPPLCSSRQERPKQRRHPLNGWLQAVGNANYLPWVLVEDETSNDWEVNSKHDNLAHLYAELSGEHVIHTLKLFLMLHFTSSHLCCCTQEIIVQSV